ncbi:ion channel [Gallaecimonas sp. GXIMD4217]|uniref:ion channel n=1 Tax=Gallaecimonas sp. GXIMD4217 TaxID=3131927 RepID=UPI00311AC6E8
MLYTILINSLLVSLAVLVHYEILRQLSLFVPRLTIRHRLRVLFGVFGALCAHVIEIWLFAFGYYFMVHVDGFGTLAGNFDHSLLDCSYFSFSTYTSLGLGDIAPLGNIRFLAGLEALTGLVLITWSASFMFIEMTKFWEGK